MATFNAQKLSRRSAQIVFAKKRVNRVSDKKKCVQILFVTKKCINSFCDKRVCVNWKRKLQINAVYMAIFATCLASNFKRAVHHMFMEYVLCKACFTWLCVNEGTGFRVHCFSFCALLFLKFLMAGTSVSATKVITGQFFLFCRFPGFDPQAI